MNPHETPLTGPPPAEIPLADAPLVRVIAQIRFPLIASVERRDFIAPFQEAIRREFPVLRPEQTRGIVLAPHRVVDDRTSSLWRFHDATDHWRATLAPDFLALETTRYSSRDDFLGRFGQVLRALRDQVDPQVIDRLGVRYIDRVVGENLQDLPSLVRPEVAGIMATALGERALHAVVENVFDLPDGGRLMARWGVIPADGTIDPAAIEAIGERSWILDVDAFAEQTRPFDVDAVQMQARAFAERIYSFFRWAVTEEFLRRYGGPP